MLSVREVAQGKWHGILKSFGLEDKYLMNKHCSCPICGGVDRYRFDDKNGMGTYFCSQCGSGDGVQLVMKLKGVDFKQAATEIEIAAGFVKSVHREEKRNDDDVRVKLRRLWNSSVPVSDGDEVSRYLLGRGIALSQFPSCLRFHSSLAYYSDGSDQGKYPAMLALVSAADGSGATIHRTYLNDGKKAPVDAPKKLSQGFPYMGGAIRLFPVSETLGVAEGIETALAAATRFGVPTWATVSAGGIEAFVPPREVKNVIVFSDNDASYTGQAASFALAKRLSLGGLNVEVKIPALAGEDWADGLV